MLTNAQLIILRDDILADPILDAFPNTPDGAAGIAEIYNADAVPDFFIWRSSVPTHDVKEVIVWTEYIALGAAEKSTFELIVSNGIVDATNANVRDGLATIFSGPENAGTRTALLNLVARNATRAEALFADTTSGSGATRGSSATPFIEGNIAYQDVQHARSL